MQLVQIKFPEITVSLITYLFCHIVLKPQFFIFSVCMYTNMRKIELTPMIFKYKMFVHSFHLIFSSSPGFLDVCDKRWYSVIEVTKSKVCPAQAPYWPSIIDSTPNSTFMIRCL